MVILFKNISLIPSQYVIDLTVSIYMLDVSFELMTVIVRLLHTQEVSTLAAALSKLKLRTLRTPSVTKVTT